MVEALHGEDSLEVILGVVVAIGVIWLWYRLDQASNRWFAALPEDIRKKGLLGLLIDRIRNRRG